MKKLFAAALAAFMMLSLAACSRTTAQPESQPEASAAEPAQSSAQTEPVPEVSDDNVIHIDPNQTAPDDAADWVDEPETVQLDLEEVVSCCYTLPHLTLWSQEATDAANAAFEQLSQNFQTYAHETVYPAAQEKQAMGFLNGGYSVEPGDGALIIHYTLSVSYSTESSDTQLKHDYRVDLATGAVTQQDPA